MDAYNTFDKTHEQYPDGREVAERFVWERQHRDACEMDRTAIVVNDNVVDTIPCCTTCYFRIWSHEGARLVTQHHELQPAA